MDRRSFLDRLGRRPPPSPELTSALGDLDRLPRDRPELATAAVTLAVLLRAAFLVPDPTPIDDAEIEAMAGGWSSGITAFRSRGPRLNGPSLTARCRAIARVLVAENSAARTFSAAIRAGKVDLLAWAGAAFAGRPEEVVSRAEAAGVDPTLASSVLRLGLLPALAGISAALGRVRLEGLWERGDCPHCGSRPLLAESRGLEQRIYLRCGLCAADWPGERLRCPACGESDARSLRYSFVEGEQSRFRLSHCDSCRYAWKVVSTLTPLSSPALMVADLATIHLDVLAEPGGMAGLP